MAVFNIRTKRQKEQQEFENQQRDRQLAIQEGQLGTARVNSARDFLNRFPPGTFTLQEQNKLLGSFQEGRFEIPTERTVGGGPPVTAGIAAPGALRPATQRAATEPIGLPKDQFGVTTVSATGEPTFRPVEGVTRRSQVLGTFRDPVEKEKKGDVPKRFFTFNTSTGKFEEEEGGPSGLTGKGVDILRFTPPTAKEPKPSAGAEKAGRKKQQLLGIFKSGFFQGAEGVVKIEDQEQAFALATSKDFGLNPLDDSELKAAIAALPPKKEFGAQSPFRSPIAEGGGLQSPFQSPVVNRTQFDISQLGGGRQAAPAPGQQPPPPQQGQAGGSREFATEQEANAALSRGEIKIGDEIILGGRRVRVQQ